MSISPVVYRPKKIDAGVGKANGLVLLRIRIEGRFSDVW